MSASAGIRPVALYSGAESEILFDVVHASRITFSTVNLIFADFSRVKTIL